MKLDKFFEKATAATQDFLRLLTSQQCMNPMDQKVIQRIDSEEKLSHLLKLFTEKNTQGSSALYPVCVARYLNQMLLQLHYRTQVTQSQPKETNPEKNSENDFATEDFFFTPIEPITLIHNKTTTHTQISGYLTPLLEILNTKKTNLLHGWRLVETEKAFRFSNKATGRDWKAFLWCIGEIPTEAKIQPISFDKNINENPDEEIQCWLSVAQYYAICKNHGITVVEETHYLQNIKLLLEEDLPHEDEKLSRTITILKGIAQKGDAQVLSVCIERLLGSIGEKSANGLSVFCSTLNRITSAYRSMQNLNKHFELIGEAIHSEEQRESMKALIFEPMPEIPQEISTTLCSINHGLFLLSKTAETLPTLPSPYDFNDETIISDIFINLDSIKLKMREITRFFIDEKTTKTQRRILCDWVKRSLMDVLSRSTSQLYAKNCFRLTIQLSIILINFIVAIKPLGDKEQALSLNNCLHKIKISLVNAEISSGRYEMALHWIEFIKPIPCTFTESNAKQFYYGNAINLIETATIAQLSGDLKAARLYAEQSKQSMDNTLKLFLKNIDLTNIQIFFGETKSLLRSFAHFYFALGTEQLQDNDSVGAIESFSLFDQYYGHSILRDLISAINNAQRVQRFSQPDRPTPNRLTKCSVENTRWGIIRNFLSIKSWIESNTPENTTLAVQQESITLSSTQAELIKRLSANLTSNKVTHNKAIQETKNKKDKKDKKTDSSITFSDFSSLRLTDIQSSFSKDTLENIANTSTSPPKITVNCCDDDTLLPTELLQFRSLRNAHYASLSKNQTDTAPGLIEMTSAFIKNAKDPLLTVKALQLLIRVNLTQSFSQWELGHEAEYLTYLDSAKALAERAHQLAQQPNPEMSHLLASITSAITEHTHVTQSCLFRGNFQQATQTLDSIQNTDATNKSLFHWMRLGREAIPLYCTIFTVAREHILKTSVCFDKNDYKKLEGLLYSITQVSFEMTYELFTQATLKESDEQKANLVEQQMKLALKRLGDLREPLSIKKSPHIQWYVYVIQSLFNDSTDIESQTRLDQALALAQKHNNLIHQVDILLRKIDWHCIKQSSDPFQKMIPEVDKLFSLLRSLSNSHPSLNDKLRDFIVLIVLTYFYKELALSGEAFACLPTSMLNAADSVMTLQLQILDYFETTLLPKENTSPLQSYNKEVILNLRKILACNKKTIAAICFEETALQPLATERFSSVGDLVLIPNILIASAALLAYEGELISPENPIFGIISHYNKMQSTIDTEDPRDPATCSQLKEHYLAVMARVKETMAKRIFSIIPLLCEPEEQPADHWLARLNDLIDCLNKAHIPSSGPIAATHRPLIERMQRAFPENPYMAYTFFRAHTDSIPVKTPCPRALEACLFAANAGYPQAIFRYSQLLQTGDYCATTDWILAKQRLQEMADKGYYKAQLRLAKVHLNGLFGYDKNTKTANAAAIQAMENPETPLNSRQKILSRYEDENLIFIPYQFP